MSMPEPQPSGGFEWTQAPWGAVLQCRPLAALAEHFFTAKDLMLRGDIKEWNAVAGYAGVDPKDLLSVRQVHGAGVTAVSSDRPRPWSPPEADALVCNDPSAAISVRVADCVPILLADDTGRWVAAIHAGWRGTAKRAVIAAVEAMQALYGVRPERLTAAVGPCIGPCCYEVGEDVLDGFRTAGHHAQILAAWFSPAEAGKLRLDLWRATRDQLEGAGLLPPNIHVSELCTKTHAQMFHSYRVSGSQAGRMIAVIRASRFGDGVSVGV
jgi:YfiH family protein